jgi:hypothetical protein
LLVSRALNIGAIHRRDGQINRQLDRVVGPGQALGALHLLRELAQPALELVRVAKHSSEATAFHIVNGSWPAQSAPGSLQNRSTRTARRLHG